jgi:uncharacterized membrane-anchored protein
MKPSVIAVAMACALWAGTAFAQDDAANADKRQQLIQSLHFQTGDIALAKADAHLHLQPGFRYLNQADARKVLENLWGNPPDEDVLGLLVPDNAGLDSDHSWAVVLTYSDEDGHVSDEDAAKIDYTKLLKDMQEGIRDANDERKKAGYGTIELIGWAQPPRYDAQSKKLHWAKELAFSDANGHTLNYDIRVLGREGYLSLEAVSDMSDQALVNEGMQQVLPMAEFDSGHRYADFNPKTDKLAEYGLAALVAGGIAAKTGLLAKIGLMLLAAKKLVVVAFLAVVAFVKKIFGKGGRGGGTVSK